MPDTPAEEGRVDPASAARRIKTEALHRGFSHVGIARAGVLDQEGARLRAWLDRGYEASMRWMSGRASERINVAGLVPGARSVISLGLNYYTPQEHAAEPETGKISRYAWGDDYHDVMSDRLRALWDWMLEEWPAAKGKWYVDTGPVMEKAWAQRSGIGWIGKHANVITRDSGSWVFLGEIITTLDLPADEPATDHCGTCTLCIEACPTQAIVEPYVVDSNLCLSYLTIEHRGEFPAGPAGHVGGWIFGCDICQDVCPWNKRFSRPAEEKEFAPREGNAAPRLADWIRMDAVEFEKRFQGSAVRRTKHQGLMRNIRAAIGTAGRENSSR
jgi:epoxyqueuosine reductase